MSSVFVQSSKLSSLFCCICFIQITCLLPVSYSLYRLDTHYREQLYLLRRLSFGKSLVFAVTFLLIAKPYYQQSGYVILNNYVTALPSITHLLHFGPEMGYTCEANDVVNGIPTKQYKAHLSSPTIGGEFDITYHWSGNFTWHHQRYVGQYHKTYWPL